MLEEYEYKPNRNFTVSISTEAFTTKPVKKDAKVVPEGTTRVNQIEFYDIGLDEAIELLQVVRLGYAFTVNFTHDTATLGMKNKKKEYFKAAYFFAIDLDHQKENMASFVSGLNFKPNFCYTTYSNGVNNEYAYRLVYLLEKPITDSTEYENKLRGFADMIGVLDRLDKYCIDAARYFNGSYGCDYIVNPDEYRIDPDFIPEKPKYTTTSTTTSDEPVKQPKEKKVSKMVVKNNIYKVSNEYNINLTHQKLNLSKDFSTDFNTLSFSDFVSKYKGVFNESRETKIDSDENGIKWITPDYMRIEYSWTKDEQGRSHIKKIMNGYRHNTMYKIACLFRGINQDITSEGLVYAVTKELLCNFELDEEMNRESILSVCKSVMELDSIRNTYRTKSKFRVDKAYADAVGKTCQKVAAEQRTREHDEQIGLYFDGLKSDKENIAILKQNGVKVTPKYLKVFREKYGMTLDDLRKEKIIQMIQDGYKDKDIMSELNISKATLWKLKKKM